MSDNSEWYQRRSDNKSRKNSGYNNYRSEYMRDEGRVVHSFAFRRLQGKTQLLGIEQGDYHRNRLTHSLKIMFREDPRDQSTPLAMTTLLTKLFQTELLNNQNTQWLLNTMRRNKLYPNRLMGLLPYKTPVAHKTGTATGYTNDVGIITLPHHAGHIAISAFIKESSNGRPHPQKKDS